MDVIRDLAHRLPVIVICDMLGIPEDHRAAFLVGSNVSGRILDPVPMTREELDHANVATKMGNDYFDQLCELRRSEPQDDLTTELVRAEEAGDRLSTEELHANIGLLFGAGHETTTNLIGNGLLALHRAPEQWQRLKDDPSLIPDAIEELLRFDSSVQMTGRVTNTEVEIGGVMLPPDESVVMLLGAANRDPAHYADPGQARCRPPERATDVVRRRHSSLPGRAARAARGRTGLHRAGRAPADPRIAGEGRARPGGAPSPCAACTSSRRCGTSHGRTLAGRGWPAPGRPPLPRG